MTGTIDGEYWSDLTFADDMVLLSESAERLQKKVHKCEVMIIKHDKSAHFGVENATLEQVEEYNYLGQVVSARPKHVKEIRCRRGKGPNNEM